MRRIFVVCFFVLFLAAGVEAAVIEGGIYGTDLQLVENSVVKLLNKDGTVVQSIIVEDGLYSFEVESGTYLVMAEVLFDGKVEFAALEKVEVLDTARVDLVVFPYSGDLLDEFDPGFDFGDEKNLGLFWFVLIVVVLLILFFAYKKGWKKRVKKGKSGDLPKDLKDMVKMIEKKGGRINQSDLRKDLPYSEAKVSLMITDLESRGWIKRVKKGRGNVLILR